MQDWVFTDGYAKDGKSVERKFAEALESADEVAVYAKLPKGFAIPTPVGNYSPDWAIAFKKGKTRHIFFIAETKGSLDTMQLRPIEQAKISCAERYFQQISKKLSDEDKVSFYKVSTFADLMEKIGRHDAV